jgi:hypothetical protein
VKRLLGILLPVLALLAPTSTAWARGDGWEPLDFPDLEYTGCEGTNFFIDATANKEYGRVVTIGGQDVFQITGTLKETVTNLDTGQSIDLESSGPGMLPLDEPRIIGQGNWFFFLMPGQSGETGLPDLFTTSGHIDFTVDENGVFQSFELNGTMTDLCEVLT